MSFILTVGGIDLEGVEYSSMKAHAVELPKALIVPFFEEFGASMSVVAAKSFMRALRTTESAIKGLTKELRRSTLAHRSSTLKNPLMLLHDGIRVVYAAEAVLPKEQYRKDPLDRVGLLSFANQSGRSQVDYGNGYLRLTLSSPRPADAMEYAPAIQVRIPIFVDGRIIISRGLFKAVVRNSMISDEDPIPGYSRYSTAYLAAFLAGDLSKMLEKQPMYSAWIQGLKEYPILLHEAMVWADRYSQGSFTASLSKQLRKHLALLNVGAEVPDGSPTVINSWYAVMDTLAYYAVRIDDDLEKRRKAEKSIFNFFASKGPRPLITDMGVEI